MSTEAATCSTESGTSSTSANVSSESANTDEAATASTSSATDSDEDATASARQATSALRRAYRRASGERAARFRRACGERHGERAARVIHSWRQGTATNSNSELSVERKMKEQQLMGSEDGRTAGRAIEANGRRRLGAIQSKVHPAMAQRQAL